MYAQKIFLNLLAFIFFVAGIVVGQPQGPMSGAAPKSFTTLPNDVGFLNNSINMFTGQVQFSLPIMGLSGKGNAGYSLALSYSSANVKYISSTWNQEAPTGVMGLGWSFDMPRIVADYKGTGTRDDDDFYIMEGGVSSLLIYDGLDGSDWKYYPKNYQFWKIRYSPSSEKWTITKEDGTKFIYGDANSNRSTVQNMVKWGNWIGNSFNGSGQSLMAYVWNLSETIDLWGDKITFEYQLDKERVGQGIGFMDHTKASYLKEVRNLNGERISFNYLDKINTGGPIEFVDPHTESAEPDAYQEKFESKYLDKVIRYDASNAVMGEIRFGYEITGVGNMAKRRLASIIPYAANSTSTKGYAFQYEANGSDEYNTGALTAVITPTSGSISYNYQKQELANTQLDYLVSPFNAYKEPAIWVGDDFVVIARRNVPGGGYSDHSTDPQSVILDVFTWDGGKWIKQSLGTSYNSTGTLFGVKAKDLGNGYKSHDLQFVAGKGFFGFLNRQGNTNTYNLNLYTKNENKSGEWDSQLFQFGRTLAVVDSNYPWHIDLGDEPILLAGDEFVLIGTQASRNFAFRWDGSVWSETWEANSNGDYRYAAANNYFVIHNKNGSGTDLISFKNLDKSKAWQTHTLPSNQSFNSDGGGNSNWHASASFAIVLADDNNEFIYTWSENFSTFYKYNTNIAIEDNSFVRVYNNSLALLVRPGGWENGTSDAGYGFRYDGQTWIPSGALDYYGVPTYIRNMFSIGDDFIYRPYRTTSPTINFWGKVRRFNANTNTWLSDWQFSRGTNDVKSIAGSNFLTAGGAFYFLQADNTFSVPDFNTYLSASNQDLYPTQAGLDFVASRVHGTPAKTGVIFLKNGAVFSDEIIHNPVDVISTWNETIYDITIVNTQPFGLVPSPQVGAQTFVTYLSAGTNSYQDATHYRIYRKLGEAFEGKLKTFVATQVNKIDENQTISDTYSYDLASAYTDASGTIPQFNKVTFYPGNNASLYGYVENYFVNGETATNFPNEGGNITTYYKRFTGLSYRSNTYSSTALVSESISDWKSITRFQGYYIRPIVNISKQDGLEIKKTIAYDELYSGLPTLETVVSKSGGSDYNTVSIEYGYWWNYYDPSRLKNILSLPAYQRKTVSGTITEASAIKYKDWAPLSSPSPQFIYNWTHTGSSNFSYWGSGQTPPAADWLLSNTILEMDNRGLVTQNLDRSGIVKTKIYDATKPLVLAEIENSTLQEIYFNNFETVTSNYSTDAKTGLKSSTASLVVSKPGTGTYTLSYWKKPSGESWSFVSIPITANITIGGSGELIDEVRVYGSKVLLTTYGYNKFNNLISVCDPNGKVLYMEFDDFNREKIIKDNDRNIVKYNYYNLKN